MQHAHELVNEQYRQGHLKLSTSPWNTPIFVIKKKSGKYRLLHDLRAVNEQMEAMGALQPGLPNPAMIPKDWSLLIVDLKDCFFTIALHPKDMKRFAFTLPAINREGPDQLFEWTVLPQGMRNSPTLCQLYVGTALQPLRKMWPEMIIYHYMDDILFAAPHSFTEQHVEQIQKTLQKFSLKVAPEKIQLTAPWKYLGWTLTDQVVKPQKLELVPNIQTLNDAQKLLGDLQWLKPIVGIPAELLNQLRPLLRGTDPTSPVTLTELQKDCLQQIMDCVIQGQVNRRDLDLPIDLTIWNGQKYLLGALTQIKKKTGEVGVLEWLSPALQQSKTIVQKIEMLADLIKKGRDRIVQVTGLEPHSIRLPLEKNTLDWYLKNSEELQEAILGTSSTITTNVKLQPPLNWIGHWEWIVKPKREKCPVTNALTAYTDAGKRSQTAAITWKEEEQWKHQILQAEKGDSLQTMELRAVVWALANLKGPLNVVSDSLYVVGVVERIEDAAIREVQNERLLEIFMQLQKVTKGREHAYAVIHIRSHKWDIGLGEGNARADRLVTVTQKTPLSQHTAARQAHSSFHQNAKGLHREFRIPLAEAKAIVRACPICSHHNGGLGLGMGVNPRGLQANELWQMDVTHVPEFGRLKYVHVTVDTWSRYIWATAQAGEKALHVERHLYSCFAVMGTPKGIKTDNGPAYVSKRVEELLQQWGIEHTTGIPHSPQGQAIVERANGTLKRYIGRFPEEKDPQMRLTKALFVLNHLCIFGDSDLPAAIRHFQTREVKQNQKETWVNYKDPKSGIWHGPAKVIYWGRGYLCVSTPTGNQWIPARWVKPCFDDPGRLSVECRGEGETGTESDHTDISSS